jgi:hypothetical protein
MLAGDVHEGERVESAAVFEPLDIRQHVGQNESGHGGGGGDVAGSSHGNLLRVAHFDVGAGFAVSAKNLFPNRCLYSNHPVFLVNTLFVSGSF